jgi:hypothetical protein
MGAILTAVWSLLSADDFAIPRWAFHELSGLLAATGSA